MDAIGQRLRLINPALMDAAWRTDRRRGLENNRLALWSGPPSLIPSATRPYRCRWNHRTPGGFVTRNAAASSSKNRWERFIGQLVDDRLPIWATLHCLFFFWFFFVIFYFLIFFFFLRSRAEMLTLLLWIFNGDGKRRDIGERRGRSNCHLTSYLRILDTFPSGSSVDTWLLIYFFFFFFLRTLTH